MGLTIVAWVSGDIDAMQAYAAESLAHFEAADDDWGRAWHLSGVGIAAMERGDTAMAHRRLTESLALFEQLGDRWASAMPLYYMGWLALGEGQEVQAQSLFERSLILRRDGDNTTDTPYMLHALAVIARRQGDFGRVVVLCSECLDLCRDAGWKQGIAWCLAELGALLAAVGQPERAARAFGAAEALRDASTVPVPASYQIKYDAEIAAVRDQLDRTAMFAAWQEGQSAPLDAVITDTLALARAVGESVPTPARPLPDGLTAREAEVLGLLAAGFSNREIAEALVVSVRTVERHADNIYGKIGTRGRDKARQYARRHSLIAAPPIQTP
jgi:ATP/maltotriose-dependent transcriptional regulator MalT